MSYDGIEHHLLESCQLAFSKQRYSRVPSYDIIIKTNDDIILGTGICLTEWLASQNGQICKWFCN